MVSEKPWGQEELLERNQLYMVKRLTMWSGQRCSLQLHRHKLETVYVLTGTLQVQICDRSVTLLAGTHLTIAPETMHRMSAPQGDVVYLEASTPEVDDVVRLEDDYGRS